MTATSYAIAVGQNVALASMSNLSLIIASDGNKFGDPKALPGYSAGQVVPKLDFTAYTEGYPSVVWQFGFMTYAQYAYILTNYCSGNLSAVVTVYTTLNTTTFYRMNAVLWLPQPVDQSATVWYKDLKLTFIGLEAAS